MEKRNIEEREEVINRYFEKKQGYKIIANETGIPWNTVKSWIRRYKIRNNLKTDRNVNFQKIKKPVKRIKSAANYEKRIKQLEMEVELCGIFFMQQKAS